MEFATPFEAPALRAMVLNNLARKVPTTATPRMRANTSAAVNQSGLASASAVVVEVEMVVETT